MLKKEIVREVWWCLQRGGRTKLLCLFFYCNHHVRPKNCDACSNNAPYPQYDTVSYCGRRNVSFNKRFHKSCICNYSHILNIGSGVNYQWIECETGKQSMGVDTKEINVPCQGSLPKRLRRTSVALPTNANTSSKRKYMALYNKQRKKMKEIMTLPHGEPAKGQEYEFQKY